MILFAFSSKLFVRISVCVYLAPADQITDDNDQHGCKDIRAAEMEVDVVKTRKQIEVEEKEVIRRERCDNLFSLFCLMKLVEKEVKSFNQGVGVHSTFAS